ncbi:MULTISPECIES: thiamine pyrophosphate-binding protein [unclassified Rhodococcus (in: high G+C Gram-positive bacteria)]|uniref:thiamine pyrophosphate-binding protein n=1 Tax=unclassified Rhodococcus (in: high G+C Gram-positive bacteria) TaxID=192944 RepID=UPI0024B83D6F|nr:MULTISPECIES: thiamine pyrophosphate-binding protein [unclassified Rhodococcus (in: high G+C Gram-positive bacteria)]MDI9952362.1 thiamine pyrophosphate-binding protein [Rhodococcus sp. IEGM 1305]MDI9976369.1 thiamine pyrophosphate-binding protein [Rhodococcus sp. IEGM 1307]
MNLTDHEPRTTGRNMRVADYIVAALAAEGVEHVFGVGGANIEDLYDALHRSHDVEGVVAKHEFSATTMADGYARTSNRIGVVAATSGGGALNVIAGLGEAFTSRVPLLALVGQPPTTLEGMGAFQDTSGLAGSIDATRLFGEVSVYCARVESPLDLERQLAEALAAARRGGPAVLLLPKDIQQSLGEFPEPRRAVPTAPRTTAAEIARLAEALRDDYGRVTVIAGDEVARAGARGELAELAHVLGARVAVTPDARDVLDPAAPGRLGVTGAMGNPDVVDALQDSDVCLLVGTRLPVMARGGLDGALEKTLVYSVGSAKPYLHAHHVPTRDLRATLRGLVTEIGFAASRAPVAQSEPTPIDVPSSGTSGLGYTDAVKALAAVMPAGADVFADAGNTGAAVVHHLPVPSGGRFVVALGMGGMGYTFGAAIGSAFSRGRRTFVIAGDGAFYAHGLEIHTAVEYDVPVTFVVFNNNAHAMCLTREQVYFEGAYTYSRFRPAHIAAGVGALFPGLPSHTVDTHAGLADSLRATAGSAGPAVIEVACDADELPPFLPFLPARRPTERSESREGARR